MTAVRRMAAAGLAALVLTTVPAMAATKPTAPTRPATPAAPARAAAALPPQIYQLNPVKVNPAVLPNIMILGQHLTPTTTVQVGGRPATTVQVPDANHLLMKLPENLAQGSYSVVRLGGEAARPLCDGPEGDPRRLAACVEGCARRGGRSAIAGPAAPPPGQSPVPGRAPPAAPRAWRPAHPASAPGCAWRR